MEKGSSTLPIALAVRDPEVVRRALRQIDILNRSVLLSLGGSDIAPLHKESVSMVYLQITLKVAPANRAAAAGVYARYKAPFLERIDGAKSKDLLVRPEDVQVLHGFGTVSQANAYLKSALFTDDVVGGLKPLLDAGPDIKIYEAA
jgi:hypothetical protein